MGFLGGMSGKEPTCHCRRHRRLRFNPWCEKILWRRAWQPTPVLVPEESHGQRSLVGYSPWGCKSQTRLKQLSTIPNMRRVLQYILNETVGKIYAVELHSLFIIKI